MAFGELRLQQVYLTQLEKIKGVPSPQGTESFL